jgi:four helix bundle protein
MDNKEFSKQLEKRTRKFAVNVIKLSIQLPNTPEGKVVRSQITKSGSSIGANYREANRSRSKADVANKIKICESETNETIYWLEIIVDLIWLDNSKTDPQLKEAEELLAIFTSISNTLKS